MIVEQLPTIPRRPALRMRRPWWLLCVGWLVLGWAVRPAYGQREGNVWYFGQYAGLDFNGPVPKALTNSIMNQWEGCASMCNANGQLLFYSDGLRVYTAKHEVMANGTDLRGEDTATQSACIVAAPGSPGQYYLFTTSYNAAAHGLQYSVVDMNRQGGQGEVVIKNVPLLQPCTEKLTAYLHRNGRDVWILTHAWNSTAFYAFLLTPEGVAPAPIVSKTGVVHGVRDEDSGAYFPEGDDDYIGYLRVSPDGSQLAVAVKGRSTFELFDFDNTTGKVSNPVTFAARDMVSPYGVEFSPDATRLYGTTEGSRKLYQWDLTAGSAEAIAASRLEIASLGTDEESLAGALQLGPDGKIYLAVVKNQYAGVIHQPNALGVACGFVEKGIYLEGGVSNFGLPNQLAAYYKLPDWTYSGDCAGEPVNFLVTYPYGLDSVRWDFGEAASGGTNASREAQAVHRYRQPGTYQVALTTYKSGLALTTAKSVRVKPTPPLDLGPDTVLCQQNKLTLEVEVEGAQYRWSDGSVASSLSVEMPGRYWVVVTKEGCTATDTIQIGFRDCPVRIPNVFTPNGDGYNDTFVTEGFTPGLCTLEVYDRWGKQVYVSAGYRNDWDGAALPHGVYYYQLADPQRQQRYRGWVQILK